MNSGAYMKTPIGAELNSSAKQDRSCEDSSLLREILRKENLTLALNRVVKNKGSAGIDNMETTELKDYLKENWVKIKESILTGTYRPKHVKQVEIPKAHGKGVRQLGIPTVLDRFIQQAMLQVLGPIFDPKFSKYSFGFRPGKGPHPAVKQARKHIEEGNTVVVDLDLEKFFDRVNHDILMSKIAKVIADKKVLKLIRTFLNTKTQHQDGTTSRSEGTPQGSPLSPLLSNIMLDEIDKELEARGHKFCRYADDLNIYVKSIKAGQRVFESIRRHLQKRLKLKVNQEKSAVQNTGPGNRKFLGFGILGYKNPRIRIHDSAQKAFKDKVREITRGHRSQNIEGRVKQLNQLLRGWIGYYYLADVSYILKRLDGWIKHRLRMCLFKQWVKPKTRKKNMLALGLEKEMQHVYSSGKKYWHISDICSSRFLLNNKYWEEKGLLSLVTEWGRLRGAL